jgi:GNAT superfamily N-acetyltransferase
MAVALVPSWTYLNSLNLFRPYADEVPWHLFDEHPAAVPGFDEIVQECLDDRPGRYLRVAKRDDAVVGVYLMRLLPGTQPRSFELCYLLVVPSERSQGLGRWLLRHAMGIAESKGGESLAARPGAVNRFLEARGFARTGDVLSFAFTPE